MPGFVPGIHGFFRVPMRAEGQNKSGLKSRADMGTSSGYITPARHVRAFCV